MEKKVDSVRGKQRRLLIVRVLSARERETEGEGGVCVESKDDERGFWCFINMGLVPAQGQKNMIEPVVPVFFHQQQNASDLPIS